MQINLTNDDMDYLVAESGFSKSRVSQIVRKANRDVFLFLVKKVSEEA